MPFVFDGGPYKREHWASMNPKGWLQWVCLAIIFVSLPLLFVAKYQRNAAQSEVLDLRQQMEHLQAQLNDLQSSSVATLTADNARLRAENQGYAQKFAKATNDLALTAAARDKFAGQLQTARLALSMQQDHLQQLTVVNQQQAASVPPPLTSDDAQALCIRNLHQIDLAKQAWALDNSKDGTDTPTEKDLLPYIKSGAMPACPSGGTYTIGAMNELPACSVPNHALPQQ